MKEFGPISLCNVSYKIISKVLCQRLKKILPQLVSETQSAFVVRCVISDNILIAQEAFHAFSTKDKCKKEFMTVKTDMSKAYDRIEWCFLKKLMEKMGFSCKWIHRIMTCVNSVFYQILLNSQPKGYYTKETLYRRCFLFIEALIANRDGSQGLRLHKQTRPFHTYISLFFCKASVSQSNEILRVLTPYTGMHQGNGATSTNRQSSLKSW